MSELDPIDGEPLTIQLPKEAAKRAQFSRALAGFAPKLIRHDLMQVIVPTAVSNLLETFLSDHLVENPPEARRPPWDAPAAGGYHDYSSLMYDINNLENNLGKYVKAETVGQSVEGRSICAIRIKTELPVTKRVLLIGCHHACERISVEIPYMIGAAIAEQRQKRLSMGLLDTVEFVVIPMLNPDGHSFFTVAHDDWPDWRKNRRPNPAWSDLDPLFGGYGVDLNRNYPKAWGKGDASRDSPLDWRYCGDKPFSEPETQAVKALFERETYDGLLSYHSYGQKVFFPWAYPADSIGDPRAKSLKQLAETMALQSSRAGQSYSAGPASSAYPLPIGGDLCDWVLSCYGIPALTVELPSNSPSPGFWLPASEIQASFDGHWPAAVTFFESLL